ncbi:hypothetical protein DFH28DRAFT_1112372 [Melampsora americana]|nr:hypothetical protein DFH28DRAFT_1112372 [Melampsora americana]
MPGFILTTKRPLLAWIDPGVVDWPSITHCTTDLTVETLLWTAFPFHALLRLYPCSGTSQKMPPTNSQGQSQSNGSPFGERPYLSVHSEHGSHPTLEQSTPSDGRRGGGSFTPLPSLMTADGKEDNPIYHGAIRPTYISPSITPQGLHTSRKPSPGSPAASSDIKILSAKITPHGSGDRKPGKTFDKMN